MFASLDLARRGLSLSLAEVGGNEERKTKKEREREREREIKKSTWILLPSDRESRKEKIDNCG